MRVERVEDEVEFGASRRSTPERERSTVPSHAQAQAACAPRAVLDSLVQREEPASFEPPTEGALGPRAERRDVYPFIDRVRTEATGSEPGAELPVLQAQLAAFASHAGPTKLEGQIAAFRRICRERSRRAVLRGRSARTEEGRSPQKKECRQKSDARGDITPHGPYPPRHMAFPIHDKIQLQLKLRGRRKKDLAAFLGIAPQTMTDICKGRSAVTLMHLKGLIRFFDLRASYWLDDLREEPAPFDRVDLFDNVDMRRLEQVLLQPTGAENAARELSANMQTRELQLREAGITAPVALNQAIQRARSSEGTLPREDALGGASA